ncbi:MAG: AMP-dependent synthetase, partial [Cyanophyceae cyanobacterium]
RGRNHYPQDIEATVEQCHAALRPSCSAAFALEVEGRERLVVAAEVERNHLRHLRTEQVVANIRQAITAHHGLQVHAVALLKTGSIPKTSSGKIRRSTCRDRFLQKSLAVVTGKQGTEAREYAGIS